MSVVPLSKLVAVLVRYIKANTLLAIPRLSITQRKDRIPAIIRHYSLYLQHQLCSTPFTMQWINMVLLAAPLACTVVAESEITYPKANEYTDSDW